MRQLERQTKYLLDVFLNNYKLIRKQNRNLATHIEFFLNNRGLIEFHKNGNEVTLRSNIRAIKPIKGGYRILY